ncbi:hypothetical protein [Nonomuraea sp. SBT364]|uniref:hypothetical protein n=1 Tax=Nonomuraea sp. SBT364 TaxID=1580530 RepID=UPI000B01FF90|nr:hypothetical protein [Nonomuraea sp. SBT364]
MTTRTEQETRRGAPARGTVPTTGPATGGTPGPAAGPKTGRRRSDVPHPAKPVPETEPRPARARPTPDPKARPAAERPSRTGAERPSRTGAERADGGVRGAAEGATRRPAGATRTRSGAPADSSSEARLSPKGRTRPAEEARTGTRPGVGTPTRRPRTDRGRGVAGGGATVRRRPARRQRAPFVLLVVGLLCGGLVSLLLLNTVLAQDSITASTLVDEIAAERQQNEDLKRKNEAGKLPTEIARRAEELGMRPAWDKVNPYTAESGQAVQGR